MAAVLVQIVQTVEQVHQGGFAAAGAAQHGKGATRRDGKGNIVQNRLLVFVAEGDMVKDDVAVHRRCQGIRCILLRLGIQDISDTVDGNAGLAHLRQNLAQTAHRPAQGRIVGNERQKLTQRNLPVDCADRTHADNRQHLNRHNQVAGAPVGGHHVAQPNPQIREGDILFVKAVDFKPLPAKRTDYADTGEVLLNRRGQGAFRNIRLHEALGNLGAEEVRVEHDNRDEHRCHQRDFDIHREHQPHGHDDEEADAEYLDHLCADEVADDIHIRGTALDDFTGLVSGVPGKRQLLDVGIQLVTQRFDGALRGLGGIEPRKETEQTRQHRCHQHTRRCQQQHLARVAADHRTQSQTLHPTRQASLANDGVHRHADNLRCHGIKGGVEHRAEKPQPKQPQISPDEAKDHARIFLLIFVQTNHSPILSKIFLPLFCRAALSFPLQFRPPRKPPTRSRSRFDPVQENKKAPLSIVQGCLYQQIQIDESCLVRKQTRPVLPAAQLPWY